MDEDVFEVPGRTEYLYLVQEEAAQEEVQYARHRHYISPLLVLSRRCVLFILLCVLSLLSLASYLAYVAQTLPSGAAQVTTSCGAFRGRHINGAYSFKGMPYAAPPRGPSALGPPGPPRYVVAVFRTRDVSAAYVLRLPVMVWIHGGFLHMLSGGEPGYSPTEKLAADTEMVFVSFNYRLNAFGFMALNMLREGSPSNTSGNYGFMDQIAALKWVQENIHVFGGDPEKVTIFGQSSGGTSVWTMMMSPLAKGLFRAAVDMSGSYVYNATLEQAESDNLLFLQRTGCSDPSCLRRLPIADVLKAVPWQEFPSWAADEVMDLPLREHFVGPMAVVDGYVLEAPPFEVWEKKKGNYNDVPFVIGTTEQEADFRPRAENISSWTWGDYSWFVTDKLRSFSETLPSDALELYPSSARCPTADRCPERSFTSMVSDIRVTCPNNDLARRAAEALDSPVYRYVVTHTPSGPVNVSGDLLPFPSRFSFHCLDTLSFFRGLEAALGKKLSDGDRSFQDLITKHLVTFAKTGKMADEWPEYPAATALLSDQLSAVQSYSSARCQLWEENGLFAYAWTN
ncbi:hypothetical protein CgunFtcFv8_020282 [Champsocephalus gunnari]|uniref:Carboxylic ester hydrolase n=1 Tax=Champsocephalus gunnari TaxID=52237 RepID=A0AAN8I0S1_CHAGU|nr:hypothetical protein CgunFtcFv8_020282 [Champsocephalus gunnari]